MPILIILRYLLRDGSSSDVRATTDSTCIHNAVAAELVMDDIVGEKKKRKKGKRGKTASQDTTPSFVTDSFEEQMLPMQHEEFPEPSSSSSYTHVQN